MISKIFVRENGSYTLSEFEGDIQNKSVIPPKFSPADPHFKQRLTLLKEKL